VCRPKLTITDVQFSEMIPPTLKRDAAIHHAVAALLANQRISALATWTARVPATAVAPGETCNPCHSSPADLPNVSRLGIKLNGSWLGFRPNGHPVCTEIWPGNTGDTGSLIPLIDRLRKRYCRR
jgi:hypothetical protein